MRIQPPTRLPRKPNIRKSSPAQTPPNTGRDRVSFSGDSDKKEWLQAAGVIGRSALRGSMYGMGYSYMRTLGLALGGATGGGIATGVVAVLGAVDGVHRYGESAKAHLGSEKAGKVLGGFIGGSKAILMSGALTGASDPTQAILGGAVIGGVFGVIDAPRSLN